MKSLINNKFIVLIIFPFISSCGLMDEPTHVKLARCDQSSKYLERNSKLMRDAIEWRKSLTPLKPMSRQEAIQYSNESSSIMMEAMNEDTSLKKSVLIKWYESNYCRSLLADYLNSEFGQPTQQEIEVLERNKDVEYALMRQIIYYSKSMVGESNNEVPCSKFKNQFEITFNNRYAANYKSELLQGIKSTILDSSFKLKDFQKEFLIEQIEGDQLESISREINSKCFDDNKFLSEKIYNLDILPQHEPVQIIESRRKYMDKFMMPGLY